MFLHVNERVGSCHFMSTQNLAGRDVPQIGFGNDNANNLRLWDVEIPEEHELTTRPLEAVAGCKTSLLAFIQTALAMKERAALDPGMFHDQCRSADHYQIHFQGRPLKDSLREKFPVHINDTHPAVAPAEFMRLLVDEYDLNGQMLGMLRLKLRAIPIIPSCLKPWENGR